MTTTGLSIPRSDMTSPSSTASAEAAVDRSLKSEAKYGLQKLPQELYDMICGFLDNGDFLNVRGLCHQLKWRSKFEFQKRYRSDLWEVEATATRTGMHRLEALTNDPDCAECIRRISVHSTEIRPLSHKLSRAPERFKLALQELRDKECMDMTEFIESLQHIFGRISNLPNIKEIKCGALTGDFFMGRPYPLPEPIARFARELSDISEDPAWPSKTGKVGQRYFVDELYNADLTIAAVLAAFAGAKVKRAIISIVFRDASFDEFVEQWRTSRGPVSYSEQRALWAKRSREFLEIVTDASQHAYGHPYQVFSYIRKIILTEWEGYGPESMAWSSILLGSIVVEAANVSEFQISHPQATRKCIRMEYPASLPSVFGFGNIIHLQLDVIFAKCETLVNTICQFPNVEDLRLFSIILIDGTWKDVFENITRCLSLKRFCAKNLCIWKGNVSTIDLYGNGKSIDHTDTVDANGVEASALLLKGLCKSTHLGYAQNGCREVVFPKCDMWDEFKDEEFDAYRREGRQDRWWYLRLALT